MDSPASGCSAGFWMTRLRLIGSAGATATAQVVRETRVEVDFQHAAGDRCRCLGRDTDAPAVRALLDVALALVTGTTTTTVVAGGAHCRIIDSHGGGGGGDVAAAMLVFLGRVLGLPALGDAELDLWDAEHWPPPHEEGGDDDDDDDEDGEDHGHDDGEYGCDRDSVVVGLGCANTNTDNDDNNNSNDSNDDEGGAIQDGERRRRSWQPQRPPRAQKKSTGVRGVAGSGKAPSGWLRGCAASPSPRTRGERRPRRPSHYLEALKRLCSRHKGKQGISRYLRM